jgi:two-component system, cell cycle response regulator
MCQGIKTSPLPSLEELLRQNQELIEQNRALTEANLNLKKGRRRDLLEKRVLKARIEDMKTRLIEKDKEVIEAQSDGMTGLPTRPVFTKTCKRMLAGARRGERVMSCLFLDLDHFKSINDSYGHSVGDKVLKQVGEVIKQCIRENDFAGRFGGEEFVVLLDQADMKVGMEIAERIRRTISQIPMVYGREIFNVTVSIGVSEWDGKENFAGLWKRADDRMYQAKGTGRDRVCS